MTKCERLLYVLSTRLKLFIVGLYTGPRCSRG